MYVAFQQLRSSHRKVNVMRDLIDKIPSTSGDIDFANLDSEMGMFRQKDLSTHTAICGIDATVRFLRQSLDSQVLE